MRRFRSACLALCLVWGLRAEGPVLAPLGMVVSQERRASEAGREVLQAGGNAVDAAVATAFVLAVTHPVAGNIGGGGFLLLREGSGRATFFDFRETAPAAAHPAMFLEDGRYSPHLHHESGRSVGVPGTVAGLHAAWKARGRLPWPRLLEPAIRLAREGFPVSERLARSLEEYLPHFRQHPPTARQFSRKGRPYRPGECLRQPELARTLARIAAQGPDGFYKGRTARLIETAVARQGGSLTRADLGAYRVRERTPLRGSYRGFEILGAPPPSSGGLCVIQMLNILEGYNLTASGPQDVHTLHRLAESMRRAYATRARHLGDPDFAPPMPLDRLLSKAEAERLRRSIREDRASVSAPDRFEWPAESPETTHLSVVDAERNAVSLTYTLEDHYGCKRIVPGAGFLLNNEMGDFNAGPGLTDTSGLIGTEANLARPGARMLSSMAPTIVAKEGRLILVTGSPGGRTIPNTVLMTILQVVEFGADAQQAVDAPRLHHQWLPDRLFLEAGRWPPGLPEALKALGHTVSDRPAQGCAQVIRVRPDGGLEGGADRGRWSESAAAGH